jgi:hypothetical protein
LGILDECSVAGPDHDAQRHFETRRVCVRGRHEGLAGGIGERMEWLQR